jgi:hypothetical protein
MLPSTQIKCLSVDEMLSHFFCCSGIICFLNVNAPAYVFYTQVNFETFVIFLCFVMDLQIAAVMCAAVPLISRALMEMVIKETVSKLCFAIA